MRVFKFTSGEDITDKFLKDIDSNKRVELNPELYKQCVFDFNGGDTIVIIRARAKTHFITMPSIINKKHKEGIWL